MPVSPARWTAFQILRKVGSSHTFAADLMLAPPAAALDPRDAALTEELVLGVLRWQGELDAVVAAASGRRLEALDPEVRLALRLGVYQLRCLDRVPAHAAVSESVDIVKRARKASAAGFVNAVLRKAARGIPGAPPRPERCVPEWMLGRWRARYGARAEALALATLERPHTYLRLNLRFDPEETVRLLAAEGVETVATELAGCRRVLAGAVQDTQCFREGRLRIQDLGSQRVAPLLDLQPWHRFLDVCAAPGGKTFQALEARGEGSGLALAADVSPARLAVMRRLATVPVALVALNATRPLPFSGLFDRILVDAPCSGTGTLARNPEIKWRLRPADLADLAARQQTILRYSLAALAPGGRLVYSTCSLEPEENEQVVDAVAVPPYQKVEEHLWLPGEQEGDGFYACVVTCPAGL